MLEFTLNCRGGGIYLNDIQASSTSPSHIDGDRLDQCTLGKVLDLLRHSSTVKQGLSLALSCSDSEVIGLDKLPSYKINSKRRESQW